MNSVPREVGDPKTHAPSSDAPIRLLPDEEIVPDLMLSAWWTLGLYVFTLGLWAIWRPRHRIVLTNQRLVVRKGIVNKSEVGIPLARVQDVHLKTSPLNGGVVTLSTAGGSLGIGSIAMLTRADATALADSLSARTGSGGADV
jgi:membrane protein YdbS with pleckstrin-like domain